jgi:transposase InsO family protein
LRTDNLLAVRRRKFVATSDSRHPHTVYPNLAQYVRVSAVNQLWVADIAYLRLPQEFVLWPTTGKRLCTTDEKNMPRTCCCIWGSF